MNRSITILILWLILQFVPATQMASGQLLPFDNYTIHNGLPQNSVFDIVQDQQGYLWFATQVGASRFDGKGFKNYYVADGLPDNYVNCLLTDSKGRIWFGTDGGGVGRKDGINWITFRKTDGLIDDHIEKLYEDHSGRIWVMTHYGVSYITPQDSIYSYDRKNGLIHNNVISMYEDRDGNMWLGTQTGLSVFRGDSIWNKPLNDVVWGIDEDSHGNLWFATQGSGIYRYDGEIFYHYTTNEGLTSNIVISIFVDTRDQVWCGTYEGGVSMYDGKRFTSHIENGINKEVIMSFFEDSRGVLWARPNENGIYRLKKGEFHHLDKSNNLIDNYVLKIYEDNQHNLWFGTLGGVSEYAKFTFEFFTDADGLPDNSIFSVAADSKGNIWAGTNIGLARYNGSRFRIWNKNNGLPDFTITKILEDQKGRIWAASYSTISRISGEHVINYRDTTILRQSVIYDMDEDDQGRLWCATERGIYLFENNHFENPAKGTILAQQEARGICWNKGIVWVATGKGLFRFDPETKDLRVLTTDQGMPDNKCRDVVCDENGILWVATDGGLVKINRQETTSKIQTFTTKDGLESNTLYFVLPDQRGHLWIGHEKGLNRLDIETGKIRYYGVEEGFLPLETNQGAIALDKHKNIWIGTVAGLAHYDPAFERTASNPPFTFLRNILVFNEKTDLASYCDSLNPSTGLPVNLTLPYNKNSITFQYIGIHFTIPSKVTYQYKLQNYDADWSPKTPLTEVTYKKIPPGDYTFLIKAANADGVWNPTPSSFSFRIKPPFWQTGWFITLSVIAGLLLIFWIIKLRERQLIREKRILEEKVRERTKEIRKQKDEIEKQRDEIEKQRDEIQQQKEIAESQRDQIALQNREIKDSIFYAKRIQSAVLPSDEEIKSILNEYFILFKPRDIVSGDFYWLHRNQSKTVVIAADCTGHGVPGAFMSMLGVTLLNEIMSKDRVYQANLILNRLRDYIKITLGQTGKLDEAKDGMDMALVVLDEEKMEIQYSGAYNPLILIRDGELLEFKGDKMPIGIQVNEKESFTNHVIPAKPGDTLYIFSDGYADQFGGDHGGKFKIRPFKNLLLEIHANPLPEQKKILYKTLVEWMQKEQQVDDILVIGLRV
ncbi:MAG: SpoIIE family protein phosphatase [Chlorobi bacterium]|nr:SpoIIE family protein phosphatase [Chlorobiota bacterium]